MINIPKHTISSIGLLVLITILLLIKLLVVILYIGVYSSINMIIVFKIDFHYLMIIE